MIPVFEKSFVFGTSCCDMSGLCRLGSLLEAMQDTANGHTRSMHVGRDDLSAKGLTWVLFKMEIQIDRYPRLDEPVTVQTFTKGVRFKFFPRYYIVLDQAGRPICRAGSLWVLMDKATRSAVSSKESGIELPDVAGIEIPLKISAVSKKVEGEEIVRTYRPEYTDIDFNGHVNNVRYADLLCNHLGIGVMREKEVEFLSIDYSHEISPETLSQITLVMNDGEFQFTGSFEDRRFFGMYGKLRERDHDPRWGT